MKKHLLLLFGLCLVQQIVFAESRSYEQALRIAQQQAERLGISMDAVSPQQRLIKKTTDVSPAYYVFKNGRNKGFTIVSADDRLPEIVGYALRGNYDEDTQPEAYIEFITAYQEFVEDVKSGNPLALRMAAEAKALRESTSYAQPTVAPLLGDIKWNQYDPYNGMCPEYRSGERSVTGCVATAMAQVMGYWKYPSQLQNDIPGYTTKSYGINIEGISKVAAGPYDWNNILPQYKTGSFNDDQAKAIAKLMYHCGAAVKMDYGPSSAASVNPKYLFTYFGYDKDLMATVYRGAFSIMDWNKLIDHELEAKRPVLCSGESSDSGHLFVCDGSDGKGLYHINWGWGGFQDGYFDITILNPDKGGAGSGNALDGYNKYCSMIIGIMPDNGMEDTPLVTYKPIYAFNSYPEIIQDTRECVTDNFKIVFDNSFINRASTSYSGYFGWGIKDANGDVKLISTTRNISNLKQNYYIKRSNYIINYAFPIGITTIFPVYSEDGIVWKEAGREDFNYYMVEATETSIKEFYPLTADVIVENTLLTGTDNTIKLELSNPTDNDVLTLLRIYTSKDETCSNEGSQVYVSVPAKGKSVREVLIEVPAEDFYLWVKDYKTGKELISAKKMTATTSGTPIFKLVNVVTNVSDEFETEKAYYFSDRVKAPKVKDDKFMVRYDIQNDGGICSATWQIYGVNAETGYILGVNSNKIIFPGNGTITQLTATYTPEEIGSRTIYTRFSGIYDIDNTNDMQWYDITMALPRWWLEFVDQPQCNIVFSSQEAIAYVAGAEGGNGVNKVDISKTYIRGDHGQINITTDRNKSVTIYGLNGQKVAEVKAIANQTVTISVPSGFYMVDGTKVAVR